MNLEGIFPLAVSLRFIIEQVCLGVGGGAHYRAILLKEGSLLRQSSGGEAHSRARLPRGEVCLGGKSGYRVSLSPWGKTHSRSRLLGRGESDGGGGLAL
jgi:hypothetical protein